MTDETELNEKKVDGRTKEGRMLRLQEAMAAGTAPIPQPPRPGRVAARGRAGEILSRNATQVGDEFELPESMKEPGWSYQWCAVSINGDSDITLNMLQDFEANGWRPVPAGRFPGRFMKQGTPADAAIVRKGQMLMERPQSLTDEAAAEDKNKALAQMRDRDQSLMGHSANLRGSMPSGFEMGGRYRGTGGDLKISIDHGVDIPKPEHQVVKE